MIEFINEKAKMINYGFGHSQIRAEVWMQLLKNHATVLSLEAIIYLSMEVYSEIVKRANETKLG